MFMWMEDEDAGMWKWQFYWGPFPYHHTCNHLRARQTLTHIFGCQYCCKRHLTCRRASVHGVDRVRQVPEIVQDSSSIFFRT